MVDSLELAKLLQLMDKYVVTDLSIGTLRIKRPPVLPSQTLPANGTSTQASSPENDDFEAALDLLKKDFDANL